MGQEKSEPCTTQAVQNLVFFHRGQWVTTTVAIAQGMEVEHAAVVRFLREHRPDLEKFGSVAFERLPGDAQGSCAACALLNRHQAVALLLSYPADPQTVRQFAVRLLKAFLETDGRLGPEPPPPGEGHVPGLIAMHAAIEQVLQRFFPDRAELLLVMVWIMNTLADRLETQPPSRDGEPSAGQTNSTSRRLH